MHSFIGDMFMRKRRKALDENKRFNYLKRQYLIYKILSGLLYGTIGITLKYWFNDSTTLIISSIILYLLQLSAIIDGKHRIIPDVITLPLLILSLFLQIYWNQSGIDNRLIITSLYSIISVINIYGLCTITALVFYFRNQYSFGGGDVKLLSAIAAFAGAFYTAYIVVISAIFMGIFCVIKKQGQAPLAPFVFYAFLLWISLRKFAII